MIRILALPVSIGLCLLMGTPLLSEPLSGPCAAEQATWANAYQSLQIGMDAYRQTKNESISPRIARAMDTHDKGVSIARVVEVILRERRARLAELGRQCLELADAEESSFAEWRRCASGGAQRRDNSAVAAFKGVSRERTRLMAELQDLLLDEAYVQYKNHRAPAERASPSYEASQPWSVGYR
jgi:hypothetical protein